MKIIIVNKGGYKFSKSVLENKLTTFLSQKKLPQEILIEIVIVNTGDMVQLSKMYLHEKAGSVHNVLSFVESEVRDFILPPDKFKRLGTVAICYPVAKEEAKEEGILVDDKVYELAKHGLLHLLGQHHN